MAGNVADAGMKAVIFDLDGVLVDSTEAHYLAWRRICAEEGWDLSRKHFDRTVGTGNEVTVRILFGDEAESRAAGLAGRKEEAYRVEVRKNLVYIDGGAELVQRLHDAGWRLGLGTSAPHDNVLCVLENFPAAHLLEAKVDADMVARGKPAPDLFLRAAELLGVPPARCVVIEDSPAGLDAAEKAGMARVALTTTFDLAELASKSDLIVDSLRDITPGGLAELLDD